MTFPKPPNDLWWQRGGSAAAGGVILGGSGGLELGLEGVRAPVQTRCCTWADGASSCAPQCCSRLRPLDSHRKKVQRLRLTATCHPESAACGQAAPWTRGTAQAHTAGHCARGGGLSSSPGRAQALGSTAPPLQPSSARAPCHHPWGRRRCCKLADLQPLPLHHAEELEDAV